MDDESGFGGVSVLVADADWTNRETTARLLRPYGYDVRLAADGITAWSIALGIPLDLAVIDLNLAGISAFDLLSRIRLTRDTAAVPVIVLSDDDSAALCDRAFGLGATMYLTRPLKAAQLTHLVWYVLRNEKRNTEMRALKSRLPATADAAAPPLR